MSKSSPTRLTLAKLRRHGWRCEVVERWNHHAKRRHDLFGAIDVLAIHAETPCGILGIQCTSASNHAARVKKALAEPAIRDWIASGGGFEVWSWRKSRGRWVLRTDPLGLEDFDNHVHDAA